MPDLTQYKLLIVDDERMLRDSMVFDFNRKGFTVFSAESGNTAMACVEANPIDLVVSDIRMADGDGLALLAGIRARGSGFADATEAECLEKGAFVKPFDGEQLLDTIRRLTIKSS